MKKKDHELISVEDCIDELIYGTGSSVVWHEVNGKRMSDEEYAAMIREEYAADPPAGYEFLRHALCSVLLICNTTGVTES